VQAKCYSQQHDITKHDVDKFLSESNRKGIDKRLLIATTDRIGANAKQVCDAQEKSVFRYLLSNFESASLEYPASLAELHTAKPKPKPQPKHHQSEAISTVSNSFKKVDRGQLIMACGTGKTFTTLWIKEALRSGSTLVLLPSLGLLSQTLHEWTLAANYPFEVLCVCSDDTVAKKGGDESVQTVADVAFPVTSTTADIQAFLKRSGPRVVFSTYQSSPLIAEAQADTAIPEFELAIADEAHRCAGKVDGSFTTILNPNKIRATRRLFTTATPRTYSTNVKKAAGERGIEVVGMDDEAVFGKVLFSLSFGEAIKRGLLTDYQVVIIGVDNPTIAAWIENRELLKTDTGIENDAESLAAQIGLLKAYKDYDLKRVISFHSRVSRAEAFTQDMQRVSSWISEEHRPSGTMMADFVSGAMPTDKRRRKLAQLKALAPTERGLLTNARCLSEGVDVPSLDGVAFIDPRSSQIDIIQAVGRAIRLSPDKKAGTIVLPVFIEAGDSPAESIEASNFKPIWDVLNALKAHDDVLSAEMDQIRTEMGRRGDTAVGAGAFSKIRIDLPITVENSFGQSLRVHLVERVTDSWELWFGLVAAYAVSEGISNISRGHKAMNGIDLGNWIAAQRASYWSKALSTKRIERLESLAGWSWNALDTKWENGFNHLEAYTAAHGDCNVKALFKSPDGFRLGQWIGTQRTAQNTMLSERRERLERLSGWSWNPRDDSWEAGLSHLIEYISEHGHCAVPALFKSQDAYPLGTWVVAQRTKRAEISSEQRERLATLPGWSWSLLDDAWERGFIHISEYAAAHGDCAMPTTLRTSDGYRLGAWAANQRSTKNKMPRERQERLEALQGWRWNYVDAAWESGFSHLTMYAAENDDCLVPVSFKSTDGFGLGVWVVSQRTNRNDMPQERIQKLESLRGWSWDPHADTWNLAFSYLKDYSINTGSCRVPQHLKLPNGFALGAWVAKQRANQHAMGKDRSKQLEALQGWEWRIRGS
jgi:superfamily II DNA or RNA helicase